MNVTVDDFTSFQGRHAGESCFVMGNGPSLNKMDLDLLDGQVVFGSNAATSGDGVGIQGQSLSPNGIAIRGLNGATSGAATGVRGVTRSTGDDAADGDD